MKRSAQICVIFTFLMSVPYAYSDVVVYSLNENSGLVGFSGSVQTSTIIDFEGVAANTDISGWNMSGVTLNRVGGSAPLIVVDDSTTFTPGGSAANKLTATSGTRILSPGGSELRLGRNNLFENDDLSMSFDSPVVAVGFDVLWQSADGASGVNVKVFNQFDAEIYSGSIPATSISGAGSPGGSDFFGVKATGGDLISRITIDETDGNASNPDANIGFDTIRVAAVPEPSTFFALGFGGMLSLLGIRRRQV